MTKAELNKILEIGSEIGLTFFEKAIEDGCNFENAKIIASFALHNLGFKKLFIDSFLKNLKTINN